jgi:hypothetical protein
LMTQLPHRSGEIAPVCVFKSPLGHMGVQVPKDTSHRIR